MKSNILLWQLMHNNMRKAGNVPAFIYKFKTNCLSVQCLFFRENSQAKVKFEWLIVCLYQHILRN